MQALIDRSVYAKTVTKIEELRLENRPTDYVLMKYHLKALILTGNSSGDKHCKDRFSQAGILVEELKEKHKCTKYESRFKL